MPRFTYIHLSDTHFCIQPSRRSVQQLVQRDLRNKIDTTYKQFKTFGLASILRPASYVPEIIAGAAQFCFERAGVVDGVIITGDLATTGIATDMNVAHSFITAPPTAGFYSAPRSPTIGFMEGYITLVPGNHDKYADDYGTPNGKNFELRFGSYMPNFRSGVGHWVDQKDGRKPGFIVADFSLQSRSDAEDKVIGAFGQGRVYYDVLDEVTNRSLLLRRKYSNIPLVWIIHFAPFDCGYSIKLVDFDKVIDAAIRLKIAVTLCGHTHRSSKLMVDGHIVYCGGSTGCVDKEHDARIQLMHFDVDKDCRAIRHNFLWDRSQHEFVLHSFD